MQFSEAIALVLLLPGREFAMYIHRRSSQHSNELTVNCD